MVVEVTVKMDIKRVTRNLTRIQKREIPKAVTRALNRTLANVVSEITGEIAKRMATTKRAIKGALLIKKARFVRQIATVLVTHKPIGLIEFKARQTRKGISASEWGKRRTYAHAFIAKGKAMVRRTSERFPLKTMWGPSVVQVWERIDLGARLDVIVRTKFPQHFATDLKGRLAKLSRR